MKKIGVSFPLPLPNDPDRVLDPAPIAQEAERLGFDSIWFAEHVVAPTVVTKSVSAFFTDGQVPGFQDPLIMMSRAGAVTRSLLVGTGVLLVPEHHPVRLAKMLATLDRHTGGRLILGVGAGWLEEEAEIMGVDFSRRWGQTLESLRVMKALWTGDPVAHDGRFWQFPAARSIPRPERRPHPTIYLGGVAKKVLERVIAYGDGWSPEKVTPEDLPERRATLHGLAREAGRDPAGLPISIFGKPPEVDIVTAYLEAGADRVVVGPGFAENEADCIDQMRAVAEKILPLAAKLSA